MCVLRGALYHYSYALEAEGAHSLTCMARTPRAINRILAARFALSSSQVKVLVLATRRSQPKLRNGLAPKIPAWALVWPHPVTQRIWNLQPKGFLAKLFAATTGNWKPPFFGIVRFWVAWEIVWVVWLRDERHMGSLAASRWCTVTVHLS